MSVASYFADSASDELRLDPKESSELEPDTHLSLRDDSGFEKPSNQMVFIHSFIVTNMELSPSKYLFFTATAVKWRATSNNLGNFK